MFRIKATLTENPVESASSNYRYSLILEAQGVTTHVPLRDLADAIKRIIQLFDSDNVHGVAVELEQKAYEDARTVLKTRFGG